MNNEELTKKLVSYRLLEEQKAMIESQQDALKLDISAHMVENKLETLESNGIVAQFVARTKYAFDVKGILTAVPEAINYLKLTDKDYTKLLKGHEQAIGGLRSVVSSDKSLTIREKKD